MLSIDAIMFIIKIELDFVCVLHKGLEKPKNWIYIGI